MKNTQLVKVPVSDGDWDFSFKLTQEQAFELLNARIGETVKLNGTREQIHVQDKDSLIHTMAANFLSQMMVQHQRGFSARPPSRR